MYNTICERYWDKVEEYCCQCFLPVTITSRSTHTRTKWGEISISSSFFSTFPMCMAWLCLVGSCLAIWLTDWLTNWLKVIQSSDFKIYIRNFWMMNRATTSFYASLSSKSINKVLRYTHMHNKCVFAPFKMPVLHGNTFEPHAGVSWCPHNSSITVCTLTLFIFHVAPVSNLVKTNRDGRGKWRRKRKRINKRVNSKCKCEWAKYNTTQQNTSELEVFNMQSNKLASEK